MSSTLTIIGNLVKDPELRYTANGQAVVNFTIASTQRTYKKDDNTWQDEQTVFMNCTAWRQIAENIADTFKKGNHVIAVGQLVQRSFEDKTGATKTVYELKAEYVGASMRYTSATINTPTSPHPSTKVDPWAVQSSDEVPF